MEVSRQSNGVFLASTSLLYGNRQDEATYCPIEYTKIPAW